VRRARRPAIPQARLRNRAYDASRIGPHWSRLPRAYTVIRSISAHINDTHEMRVADYELSGAARTDHHVRAQPRDDERLP